ncbi:MAG: CBS domain-containing protein [Pigmentiphaga sp.]
MSTVADILKAKGNTVVHQIRPELSVLEAMRSMALHGIGALLVHDGERIVGIVTERDYARKVLLHGRASESTPVSDIMTPGVMYVSPDDDSMSCMALMTERRMRHLPVMEGPRLVGLISIGDLVKNIIDEQQFIIDQLERYIAG